MHLVEVQETLAGMPVVEVVAVMPGSIELLALVKVELGLTIPLLSDPAWELHGQYKMRRGTRREVYLSVSTWKAYAQLFRHWRIRKPSEDIFRLGGAAVVDAAGTLAYLHRGRNPADYADPRALAEALAKLRPSR